MTINFKNFIFEYLENINQKSIFSKEEIIIKNIFDNNFMKKYTMFSTFNSFVDSIINLPNSRKNIFEKNLDIFVSITTKFSSWDDMVLKASYEFLESFFKNWSLTFK